MRTRPLIPMILFGALLWVGGANHTPPRTPEKAAPPDSGRILVIAPHCDDEILSSGELIHDALGAGQKVKVVIMTNGDGFRLAEFLEERKVLTNPSDFIEFGNQRAEESRQALAILGVPAADIEFLGFPDRGLDNIWKHFLDPARPYVSPYTKASSVPYRNASDPNTPYAALSILEQLQKILDEYQPTEIVYPMPHDAHPDHWATHAFVEYLMEKGYRRKMGTRLKERMYIVHRGPNWPSPRGERLNNTLAPPRDLLNIGYEWEVTHADADSIQQKLRAIDVFKSQEPVMGNYLKSFARANELFTRPIISTPDNIPGHIAEGVAIPPWLGTLQPTILDAVGDTMSRDLQRAADFSSVSTAMNEESLFILVRTQGPIPITTRFEADIKLYDGYPIHQISLVLVGRKLRESTETIVDEKGTRTTEFHDAAVDFNGNQIGLRLPRARVREGLLFSISSFVNGHVWVDQTPYRTIRLSDGAAAGSPENKS